METPVLNIVVFQIPSKTTKMLDRMIRSFSRDEMNGKKKMCTIKWSELCKLIEEGLWIRGLKSNNHALLAKTCCRCLTREDLLCFKIIKATYCPKKIIWEANYMRGNSVLERRCRCCNFINQGKSVLRMRSKLLLVRKDY